jgi:hypothetical protein
MSVGGAVKLIKKDIYLICYDIFRFRTLLQLTERVRSYDQRIDIFSICVDKIE